MHQYQRGEARLAKPGIRKGHSQHGDFQVLTLRVPVAGICYANGVGLECGKPLDFFNGAVIRRLSVTVGCRSPTTASWGR